MMKRAIECYSCGEEIQYDGDRPECYCFRCEDMSKPTKAELQARIKELEEKLIKLEDMNDWLIQQKAKAVSALREITKVIPKDNYCSQISTATFMQTQAKQALDEICPVESQNKSEPQKRIEELEAISTIDGKLTENSTQQIFYKINEVIKRINGE